VIVLRKTSRPFSMTLKSEAYFLVVVRIGFHQKRLFRTEKGRLMCSLPPCVQMDASSPPDIHVGFETRMLPRIAR